MTSPTTPAPYHRKCRRCHGGKTLAGAPCSLCNGAGSVEYGGPSGCVVPKADPRRPEAEARATARAEARRLHDEARATAQHAFDDATRRARERYEQAMEDARVKPVAELSPAREPARAPAREVARSVVAEIEAVAHGLFLSSLASLRVQRRGHLVPGPAGVWVGGVRTRTVAVQVEASASSWPGVRVGLVRASLDEWSRGLPAYVLLYFASGRWYLLPWSYASRQTGVTEEDVAEFRVSRDWWEGV